MNALALVDLAVSNELDGKALAEVKGSGMWHLRSSYTSTGNWSGYQFRYSSYQGQKFHDGYLQKHYVEGWKRTRTQTEYSTWDKFVRV